MGKQKKAAGPLLHILDTERFPPSIANLPAAMTINSITVYPTFRCNGKDANATNWPAWGYGETLTLQAGTAPTYNNGSPLLGRLDDSVKFNAGGYYTTADAITGDVTTEDIAIEWMSRRGSASGYHFSKYDIATSRGWLVYSSGVDIRVYISGPSNWLQLRDITIADGHWYHCIAFFKGGANGQLYINGVATGTQTGGTTGSLTNGAGITIGAANDGTSASSDTFGYAAMWKQASWLNSQLQPDVAKTRFAQLTGVYPQQARGTALPTVMARTTAGYLDKIEADGSTKLYYVGANWPRVCSRKDTNGNVVRGYLPETAATNVCLQSQTFATTPWTTTGFNATVPTTAVVCPDGITRTTNTLHEDASAATYHGVSQSRTLTAAVYTFSVFAKAAARSWIRLSGQNVVDVAFFDLANGIVGYVANATSGMQPVGNGWYRCWITWTADALGRPSNIFVAEGDNDVIFNGLDQDSLYIFGAQTELGSYPSTYIPTTTAAVTRTADSLRYKMDDGNLTAGKGSLVLDFMGANIDQTAPGVHICLSEGVGHGYMTIQNDGSNSNYSKIDIITADALVARVVGATDIWNGNKHTIRATWKTNQARQYVDGAIDGTEDTVCTIPTGLTQLDVGAYLSAAYECNGLISNLEIYGTPTLKAKPSNGR